MVCRAQGSGGYAHGHALPHAHAHGHAHAHAAHAPAALHTPLSQRAPYHRPPRPQLGKYLISSIAYR